MKQKQLMKEFKQGKASRNDIIQLEIDNKFKIAVSAEDRGQWKIASNNYDLVSKLYKELGQNELASKYNKLSKNIKLNE